MGAVEDLPEFDKPLYFGLPENIERSAQRSISASIIGQLRVVKRADVKAAKFDKDVWATELGPILNLWKKLNQVCGRVKKRSVACKYPVCIAGVGLPWWHGVYGVIPVISGTLQS